MDGSRSATDPRTTWLAPGLVCLVLFVDVDVPFFGTIAQFALFAVIPTLLLGRQTVSPWRLGAAILLLPGYFLVPPLMDDRVDFGAAASGLVQHLTFAGVVLLAAREIVDPRTRRRLTDFIVWSATASAALAVLQRVGLIGPLGRDLWGRASTATGELRGSGLLPDPNFLAILLAATVPLAMTWERGRARAFVLVGLGAGIYATNSRAGLLLGVLALVVTVAALRRVGSPTVPRRGKHLMVVAGVVLVACFALDVGGQRDRVVEGVQAALGQTDRHAAPTDMAAQVSVEDRGDFLRAWMHLGVERFPFGAGVNAQDFIVTESGKRNAAHNNFAQALGQGGVFGLGIGLLTLGSFIFLARRRAEPIAMFGAATVVGGLFLSLPGTVLFLLPLGIADAMAEIDTSNRGDAPQRTTARRPPAQRTPRA